MKIISTVCEVTTGKDGQLIFIEVKGDNGFDTYEEAVNRIQELTKRNKEASYTIIPEFIN